MKVLISAYACEPGAGSEPGAGWTWARAAALDHDVWVLTRENNAPAIEAALEAEPQLRLHPVYLDLPRWARFWKRGQRGVHLYYVLWQVLARSTAKRLHARERFDVAHHLTLAMDWMPAGVVGIPGLPAVWGPVGGATGMPWRLWRWLGWRGVLQEAAREVVTRPMRRLFGDRTAKRAALIVAQNHDVGRRFRRHGEVVVEPNVALDPDDLPQRRVPDESPRRRKVAVYAGRLIPWKGVALAVAALAESGASRWELHLYGQGPERSRLERLARRHGVRDRVVFMGQRPRSEVLAAMAEADAFLLPSFHDAGGWVVAEAVAVGSGLVGLRHGGPAVIAEAGGRGLVDVEEVTPKLLAQALAAVSPSPPSTRWTTERIPSMTTSWYERSPLHAEHAR